MFPAPVLTALAAFPGRPAFEVGSRTVTRGELLAMVRRLADGMRAVGLGPGVGVAMVLSASPEAYATHLAAHALGCRVAAARPGWSPAQLADALRTVDVVVADRPMPGPALDPADLLGRADPGGPVPVLARPDDIARLTYALAEAGHEHGVDPVSAALLVLDGLVALGVVVLLAVRRRPTG